MLEYLIDNLFCRVRRTDISANNRHTDGYCAPLLADLFLYSYEAEFVQSLLQAGKKHLAQQFNFTYRYMDDVLSLKNTKFAEYLEFIYPCELEIKETSKFHKEFMPPALFLFELLKMGKLTRGPLVLYHLPKY